MASLSGREMSFPLSQLYLTNDCTPLMRQFSMGTLAVVPEVPIGETGPERRLGDISGQRGRGRELRSPDAELISAAREAWPRVLAHAKREFNVGRSGSDSASFAVPI